MIKEVLPRGFNTLIEEQQQALTARDQAITERDTRIQKVQYENVGLQGEIRAKDLQIDRCETRITELRKRRVDHTRDPGKDNIIIIVRKHTTQESNKYHHY